MDEKAIQELKDQGLYQNVLIQEPEVQTETPSNSVFHPDNIGPVTVIQLTRIYDAMMALLAIVDPDKAMRMAEAHAQGITLTAPPAFREEDDE